MKRALGIAIALSVAPLSACGGGSSGTSAGAAAPANPQQSSHSANATVTIKIPNANATSSSSVRHAQFIGAAVAGVSLTFYFHTDTGHTTPLGTGAFDVTVNSGLCTPSTGVRDCALQQTTQTGVEDLVVTTYDAAPVSGSFSAAHQLGIGTIYNVTLAAGSNTLAVAVGGTIATLAVSPTPVFLPGGTAASYPLAYTAYDKSGEMIVAGANTVTNGVGNTETDTYSNTITLSVSEIGGSGHVLLSTGGAPAASVPITTSNTPVTVSYDGGGTNGYSAAIAATSIGATSAYAALEMQYGAGIFVANPNNATIVSFPYISSLCTTANPCTLNEAPLATITTTADPSSVALDSNGRIYTTNYFPGQQISVYANNATGNATPIETIAYANAANPQFIAVDSLGRIYVAVYDGGFLNVFAPVLATCTTASPCTNPPPIATYQTPSPPPYFSPYGIALDASNRLYANDRVNDIFATFATLPGTCTTVAPCNVAPASAIASSAGISGFEAIDPSGRVYLGGANGISVYAPLPSGCSALAPCTFSQVATISGSFGFIAIDPNGYIYSSSGGSNSITVYPPLATTCSTVSPCAVTATALASIAGGNTTLSGNQGIAVP